jgi:hypothetical protein
VPDSEDLTLPTHSLDYFTGTIHPYPKPKITPINNRKIRANQTSTFSHLPALLAFLFVVLIDVILGFPGR